MMKKRLAVRFGINCHLQVLKSSFSYFFSEKHIQIDPHDILNAIATCKHHWKSHPEITTEIMKTAPPKLRKPL